MLIPLSVLANATRSTPALVTPIVLAGVQKCETLGQCRTVWDIIWSCLATIVACIWVSVHPNMPRPQPTFKGLGIAPTASQQLSVVRHRIWSTCTSVLEKLAVALLALLAPEFLFLWAARQRLRAGRLAQECRDAAMKPSAREGRKRRRAIEAELIRRDQESFATIDNSGSEIGQHCLGAVDAGSRPEATELVPMLAIDHVDHQAKDDMSSKSTPSRKGEGSSSEDESPAGDIGPLQSERSVLPQAAPDGANYDDDDTYWTTTHAFFIIMGGFHQFDGNKPGVFLRPDDVVQLVSEGRLVPPSEEDILDRSKTDSFSKMIVLGQTLWFIMQCIARHLQHLPITQLEIATLAYTTAIVGAYVCWWHKPLGIVQPVRVSARVWSHPPQDRQNFDFTDRLSYVFDQFSGVDDNIGNLERVPRFYSGKCTTNQIKIVNVTACLVTALFGAIHCFAWSYQFPSHAERTIWQVTSLLTIGLPIIWVCTGVLANAADYLPETPSLPSLARVAWIWDTVVGLIAMLFIISFPAYFVSRTALVTVAFTSLRSLPAGAYETVNWTTYIPHI